MKCFFENRCGAVLVRDAIAHRPIRYDRILYYIDDRLTVYEHCFVSQFLRFSRIRSRWNDPRAMEEAQEFRTTKEPIEKESGYLRYYAWIQISIVAILSNRPGARQGESSHANVQCQGEIEVGHDQDQGHSVHAAQRRVVGRCRRWWEKEQRVNHQHHGKKLQTKQYVITIVVVNSSAQKQEPEHRRQASSWQRYGGLPTTTTQASTKQKVLWNLLMLPAIGFLCTERGVGIKITPKNGAFLFCLERFTVGAILLHRQYSTRKKYHNS